jgi:hypothetical protein
MNGKRLPTTRVSPEPGWKMRALGGSEPVLLPLLPPEEDEDVVADDDALDEDDPVVEAADPVVVVVPAVLEEDAEVVPLPTVVDPPAEVPPAGLVDFPHPIAVTTSSAGNIKRRYMVDSGNPAPASAEQKA